MLKKQSGTKTVKKLDIPKLDDANFAGTKHSKDCTLIITEGDSAKALVVGGLSIIGRDYYGVFPLRVFYRIQFNFIQFYSIQSNACIIYRVRC